MKGCKKTEEIRHFNVGEVYNTNYSEMLQKKTPYKQALISLLGWKKIFLQEDFPAN